MPETLFTLPAEIILMIGDYLPTADVGNLRLVAKDIELKTRLHFARHWFSKRQFMLTRNSLSALINISQTPVLQEQLRHVIVGLELFEQNAPFPYGAAQSHLHTKVTAYQQAYQDQMALLNNFEDRTMLASAFRNLPHLAMIEIRDYSAPGRTRDGTSWKSYGLSTIERETGIRLRTHHHLHGQRFSTRACLGLLGAVSDANNPSITYIECNIRAPGSGIQDGPFSITMNPTVVTNIQNLLITLNLNDTPVNNPGPNLKNFLTQTSQLRQLRINFDQTSEDRCNNFLRWLADQNLSGPVLPLLSQLEFGGSFIDLDVLKQLIDRYSATLKKMSLRRLTLVDLPDPADDKPNFWQDLLKYIEEKQWANTLNLEQLLVGHVHQQVGAQGNVCRVRFADVTLAGGSTPEVRLRSTRLTIELTKLIQGTEVVWPEPAPEEETEEEDDEDEEDEEEEEEDEDEEMTNLFGAGLPVGALGPNLPTADNLALGLMLGAALEDIGETLG